MASLQQCLLFTFIAGLTMVGGHARLVGREDRQGDRIWRNEGSLGRYYLVVYEANRPSPDQVILGQTAQANWEALSRPVRSWRDESSNKDSFARPAAFEFIWDTERGNYYETITLWRPTCPKGYVALGDVFHKDVGKPTPPEELFNKLRCLKEELAEDCRRWGVKIWDNNGSIARKDGAIWGTEPAGSSIDTKYFYGNSKHNVRPSLTPKCLKKDSVIRIES